MSLTLNIQNSFSFKTFMMGLLGASLLYALLFLYLFLVQDQTLEHLESRLASQTILIDRQGSATHETEASNNQSHSDEALGPPTPTPETEESLEDLVGRQAKSLRAAPVAGFFEETKNGLLPIAKSPMQTPFQVYKKPFILNRSKPFIAVAMNNFGLSKELSNAMIEELPSSVSFILSPYTATPEKWVQKAREAGHEIWLHIPIENNRFPIEDPGAKGLLTRVSLQYNQDRLQWLLGRATGYTGITAFTDSALDNSGTMFKNMARDTFGRGLGYFELNTAEDNFFKDIAQETATPYTQASAIVDFIDPQSENLKAVQAKINSEGGAIIVVNPSPRNIPSLKRWLESMERRGTLPIPVSAIADPDIERN